MTLPELVGKNNAELIFYTSRRLTGEEAYRMGLANVLVPQDQVRAEAMKLAQEIAECSPLGLLSTRATMRAGLADRVLAATNHELAEQTRLRATDDFKDVLKKTTKLDGELVFKFDAAEVAAKLDSNQLEFGILHAHEFAWDGERDPVLVPIGIRRRRLLGRAAVGLRVVGLDAGEAGAGVDVVGDAVVVEVVRAAH